MKQAVAAFVLLSLITASSGSQSPEAKTDDPLSWGMDAFNSGLKLLLFPAETETLPGGYECRIPVRQEHGEMKPLVRILIYTSQQ